MNQHSFFTALIRLMAVYFVFNGFSTLIPTLNYVLMWVSPGSFGSMPGVNENVFIWSTVASCAVYFILAFVLFCAAPAFAGFCLGHDDSDRTPASPDLADVLVFASGFVVAAFAILHAAGILVRPMLEILQQSEYDRDQQSRLDTATILQGLLALAVAASGLWVMRHFNRVHRWMIRKRQQ